MAQAAAAELLSYLTYPRGWDGYDGLEFTRGVVDFARHVVDVAERIFEQAGQCPDSITPGPASDGSVDVEIEHGRKTLMITIYPEELEVTQENAGETESRKKMGRTQLDLDRFVRWLSG